MYSLVVPNPPTQLIQIKVPKPKKLKKKTKIKKKREEPFVIIDS